MAFSALAGAGRASIRRTPGNTDTHIVLRGGDGTPNYASVHVQRCERMLREHGFEPRIMIDCSHANAQKDHERQIPVLPTLCHIAKVVSSAYPLLSPREVVVTLAALKVRSRAITSI